MSQHMAEASNHIPLSKRDGFLRAPDDRGTMNGFILCGQLLPEKVYERLLSHVPTDHLLNISLVCKSWCRLIRTSKLWLRIYKKTFKKETQDHPWYIFYAVFTGRLKKNLLERFSDNNNARYYLVSNSTHPYKQKTLLQRMRWRNNKEEQTIVLPNKRHKMCFSQQINVSSDNLLLYILEKHKPRLYMSIRCSGSVDEKLMGMTMCKEDSDTIGFGLRNEPKITYKNGWKKFTVTFDDYPVQQLEEIILYWAFRRGCSSIMGLTTGTVKFLLPKDYSGSGTD